MSDSTTHASRILKATEELVAQARLEQIAKEHQSIGSILDERAIQPLEEIRFQTKKSIKLDIEKRLNARRGGKAELDILSATNQAVEKFKEQGINVDSLTGNYDLEEKIWKEKTRKITYSQRRRFQQPLLHEFYQKMDDKQRTEYKEKVSGALVALAEKYRKECLEMKREFDSAGIFHPEANAHRAHCLYLIKLNKGISCENLEDAVLKKMYLEFLNEERVRLGDLSDKQKAFVEENDPAVRAERARSQTKLENRLLQSLQARKKSFAGKLKPISSLKQNRMKKSKSETSRLKDPSADDDQSLGKDSIGSTGNNRANKAEGVSPVKIFAKKLKHEKMGYMDSRQVLGDEAQRLDRGEEINYKKPRDKSNLLDEKLSSWMVKELQESEVSKTAIGKVSSTQATSFHNGRIAPLSSNTIAASATVMNFDNLLSPSDYSVSKVMPFSDFFQVIQNYQEKQLEYEKAVTQQQQQRREQLTSPDRSSSKSFQSPKKPSVIAVDDLPPVPSAGGLEHYSPVYSLQTSPSAGPVSPPKEASATKINMVQHLQQTDQQFNAYMKLAEGEQFSNKLLSRLSSNLAKPRKPRRVAPLGRDAIALTDSFGRSAKIASKGFQNIFAAPKVLGGGGSPQKTGQVDEEMEEKEGDILTRLHGQPKEKLQQSLSESQEEEASEAADRRLGGRNESHRWKSRSKSNLRIRQSGARPEDLDDFIAVYGFFHEDVSRLSEEMDCDMQSKLVAVWDSLSLSTQERLNFMEKYSSSVVAAEMGHAIDVWGEVAVLFLLLLESLSLQKKTQEGGLLLPIHLHDFLPLLTRKLHPLLTSTSNALVPISSAHDIHLQSQTPPLRSRRFPLSVLALATFRQTVIQYFDQISTEEDLLEEGSKREYNKLMNLEELKQLVDGLIPQISKVLMDKLRRVQIELEDIVPYKDKPIRDWIISNGLNSFQHNHNSNK